jgi:hypothetical protein
MKKLIPLNRFFSFLEALKNSDVATNARTNAHLSFLIRDSAGGDRLLDCGRLFQKICVDEFGPDRRFLESFG